MTFIPPFSLSAAQVSPFHVMKILGEAKQLEASGRHIIHMEIGEPDFPSLDAVNEAAYEATKQGKTHYTPTLGLPALRQKLSQFYADFYHAQVPAKRILLTPGSSSGLQLLLTAILNPGDKVLMTDPAYPCNRQFVTLLHAQAIQVPVTADTQFQLTLQTLKQHWQAGIKVVMVATPSNPTGTIIEQNVLIEMAQYLAQKNAYLLVDEIYQGLVYDRPAETILKHANLPNNVIVINSFSKFFGMTGWRLGWVVAPLNLMPTLDKLGQNLFLAAPTPSQYGALAVLNPENLQALEQRRQIFQTRRNHLYHLMTSAGFTLPVKPQGAFYLYWDVSEFTENAEQFALDLLHQQGVAVTPGKDFGQHQAHHMIRLAYTQDCEILTQAVQAMIKFTRTLPLAHKETPNHG